MKTTEIFQSIGPYIATRRGFRRVIFYNPLATGIGTFFVSWLVFNKSIAGSLAAAAFVFLLACLTGLLLRLRFRG